MVHEQTHVAQCHSLDILISELFCVFNWFNPFCYLMKHEIRLNLEYLADEAVLDREMRAKPISTTCLAWPITPQGVT
jgi:beta-lactamase regulating signal transducer with metallopeptidase domain